MREIKFRMWDKTYRKFMFVCLTNKGAYTSFGPNDPLGELKDLMQYTGLKDKNGKEIYEGDIASISDVVNGVVKYKNSGFGLYSKKTGMPYPIDHGKIEVIGNIYENPGLLTE